MVRGLRPLMRLSVERGGRIVTYEPSARDTQSGSSDRPALPALRHPDPRARPGRRQPNDLLVPLVPGADPRGPQGSRSRGSRQHRRELRRRARARGGHDRVRRAAHGRRPPCAGPRRRGRHLPGAAQHSRKVSTTSRATAYAGVELDVDLKLPGYEREVVDGLAERGLSERSLVSTMYTESLDRLGELAPGLRRGWSVPRVKRNWVRSPFALPAYAVARVMSARAARPGRRADPGRRLRGDHVPPAAGEPVGWCRPCTARAGRSTSGRWTTRAG